MEVKNQTLRRITMRIRGLCKKSSNKICTIQNKVLSLHIQLN